MLICREISASLPLGLIDEQDEVESFADLNALIDELRQLGIKHAEIHC